MIKAVLKLPKVETKKVWYGLYGGHYNCIVFFKSKPKKSKEPYYLPMALDGKYYELGDDENYLLIIGCMWLPEFNAMFPDAKVGLPTDIEITKVHQMELTTIFNEEGKMYAPEFHADGY